MILKKTIKITLILLLLLFPLFVGILSENVFFNQFYLQEQEIRHGAASMETVGHYLSSSYLYGLEILTPHKKIVIDYTNTSEVFSYLFEHVPTKAVVYPTETYYYYQITLPEIILSGNLRLLDAGNGTIHIGYFDKYDPHGETYYTTLSEKDGLTIEQQTPYEYDVTYKEKTVTFYLNDLALQQPEDIQLLPEEEFVAHIYDESGIKMFLLFNKQNSSFYYVLDEENGITDKLLPLGEEFYQGKRTQFIFLYDKTYQRKILVGVLRRNIFDNNYFDGPFDQLPPRLAIRKKIHAVYPYTKYAGGIDEHGNFKTFKNSRVAISPYYDYLDVEDFLNYTTRCDETTGPSTYWSCLVYESKRDFHKTLEEQNYTYEQSPYAEGHIQYVSQGWPANHEAKNSWTWPLKHNSNQSSTWPPNHQSNVSIIKY